jgi:hypothetical protein
LLNKTDRHIGVSVPNSLVLLREYLSRFSLQPSQPISLGGKPRLRIDGMMH